MNPLFRTGVIPSGFAVDDFAATLGSQLPDTAMAPTYGRTCYVSAEEEVPWGGGTASVSLSPENNPSTSRQQALITLARTVLRQLEQSNCTQGEMVCFVSHFLALVNEALNKALQGSSTTPPPSEGTHTSRQQALRTLARTVLRHLKQLDCNHSEMISFASHLLTLMTEKIKSSRTHTAPE